MAEVKAAGTAGRSEPPKVSIFCRPKLPKPDPAYPAFSAYSEASSDIKIATGLRRPCIDIPEINQLRLVAFLKAVNSSLESELSCRLKNGNISVPVADYRSVDQKTELIVIGDLHARLDNLESILKDKDTWKKVVEGRAHLLFLGDLIHPEFGQMNNMYDSLVLANWVMQLKMLCPHGVDWIVGNHDPVHERACKWIYDQSACYKQALANSYADGDDTRSAVAKGFIGLYSDAFIQKGGLQLAIADGFVFAHACPPPGRFKSTHDLLKLPPIYDQEDLQKIFRINPAIRDQTVSRWARFDPRRRNFKIGNYYGPKVIEHWRRFERQGKSDNVVILGHNPRSTKAKGRDFQKSQWWLGKGKARHLILVSCHETPAYLSVINGVLRFIEAGKPPRRLRKLVGSGKEY